MAMDGLNIKNSGVTAIIEYDYTAKEPDELDLAKGAIIHNIKQMPGGWWEGTLHQSGKTGMFPDNFVRVIDSSEENSVTLREKSAASNRRCKVIYSYTQVNDDELSLTVGDVIEFLGEVEEGWWRGRLKNKIGVFPSNFVISIEQSPKLASKRPASTIKSVAVAAAATTTITTLPIPTTLTVSNNININNNNNNNNNSNNNIISNNNINNTSSNNIKKTNRLSFHNSKEDLLSNSSGVSSTTSNNTVSSSSVAMSSNATDGDSAPSLPPKPLREYCRVEYPYAPQNDDELELKVGDIITIISTELPDKGWWKGELRGKVGVFPDNFVKIVPPVSPANEAQEQSQQQPQQPTQQPLQQSLQPQQQHTQRTANNRPNSIPTNATTTTTTTQLGTASSNNNNIAVVSSSTAANTTTSKVFIKKSGSSSSSSAHGGSQRKDSFGSRDSLNDILSETGLPSGNVAAQRKSLENKNLDLTKKQVPLPESSSSKILNTQSSVNNSSNSTTNELRKSLENMDEKAKPTQPPMLTKKPNVATKKSSTVSSVAGNILSGLKQRVKGVENKLTTAASSDAADGIGSSRMSSSPSAFPDVAPSGQIIMRRAATIGGDDTEFDNVERASILPDMRAGRVRAPKRRPPSTANNNLSEGTNNSNSIYLNGSEGAGGDNSEVESNNKLTTQHSSDDNSTGEEHLAKPKPREWQKKKAPWMEELKASQVRKKVSPNVDRTSKLLETAETTSVTKVQSCNISSSSVMQQSMTIDSKKDEAIAMTRSMTSKIISSEISTSTGLTATLDDVRARPNSLSIRNSIISSLKSGSTSGNAAPAIGTSATTIINNESEQMGNNGVTKSVSSAVLVTNNNSHHEEPISEEEVSNARVLDLERRVDKLENVVQTQQRTIEELVRALREETDRVKLLRGELDKYAQCVTQV